MNRHARRILEKKLGEDFPLEQFLALMGYYNKSLGLDVNEFMIFLLKKYIPIDYEEHRDILEQTFEGDIDDFVEE